jgi:hypothetical protein
VRYQPDRDVVRLIPLSEIERSWEPVELSDGKLAGGNIRSAIRDRDPRSPTCGQIVGLGGDDPDDPRQVTGKTGFLDLKASIGSTGDISTGQLTPAVVRPHPDPESGKPYMLVEGFQRAECAEQLQREWGVAVPVLRCVVIEMDAPEVLRRQLAEDARSPHTDADICYAIRELRKLEPKLRPADLVGSVGKSLPHLMLIFTVLNNLNDQEGQEFLDQWRRLKYPLALRKVYEISQIRDHEKRRLAWHLVTRGRCSYCRKPYERGHVCSVKNEEAKVFYGQFRGMRGWVRSAMGDAILTASAIGFAVREGLLSIADREKLVSSAGFAALVPVPPPPGRTDNRPDRHAASVKIHQGDVEFVESIFRQTLEETLAGKRKQTFGEIRVLIPGSNDRATKKKMQEEET